MANTENIEAKLCAYIDGELDAQGRAEIEKHLAANPQHRGLIAELSKQREMLRALPRESAPEEIMEFLQGQLERAGLLGDDAAAEAEAQAMRINRWPQVMAAAAIVFLAVGLVGIIYFVLPSQTGDDTYAVGTLATPPVGDAAFSKTGTTAEAKIEAIAGVPSDDAFARRDVSGALGEAAVAPAAAEPPSDPSQPSVAMKDVDSAARAAPAVAPATTPPLPTELAAAPAITNDVFSARPGKRGDIDAAAAGAGADIRTAQERLFSADLTRQLQNQPGGIQQNSVVLFVCASDPNAANSEVTNFLVSNNIQWEDVAEGPPAPLDPNVAREMHLSKNTPTRVQSKSMTFRQATQSPDVTIDQTVTLPPVQPKTEAEAQAEAQVQAPAQPQEQVAVAPPATQETPGEREMIQRRAGGEGQTIANADARRQRMIIARNMTPKQAADLNGSLLKQSYVQSAACYPAPMTAGAIPATQDVTLELPDVQKQKMPSLVAEADQLTRSRTQESTVTHDVDALTNGAKDATTAANAPASGGAAPAPPAAASADPPAAPLEDAAAPTTTPTGDVGALALAPAPATVPAFGEENERVDVVIVLQDDQPADAALLPSSAPANLAPDAQPAEPEPAESPAADPAQAPQQSPAAEPPVVDSPAP